MTVPQDIRDKAEEIATRHAIASRPLLYMLHGLKLRPEIVDLFAAMADYGFSEARIVEAAEALTGYPDV